MADNNLARSRNDLPDFFADDDPLAELARIVGYEDRPVARPAAAPLPRREPAFNLEDELLREFEQYDAPRLDPANDIALDEAPRRALEPPALFEPSFEQPEPRFAPDENRFDAQEEIAPAFEQAAYDARFDAPAYEEADSAFSVDNAQDVVEAAPAAWQPEETVRFEPVFDLPDVPVAGPVSVIPAATAHPQPAAEEFDLAAELENSFGAEEPSPAESVIFAAPEPEVNLAPAFFPVAEPDVKQDAKAKGYVPGFRMPLANFNIARETADSAPQTAVPATAVPEPKFDLPVLADMPTEKPAQSVDEAWTFTKPAAPALFPSVEVARSEAPVESASAPVVPAKPVPVAAGVREQLSALDELIHDVQRYSLPASVAKSETKAAEVEPASVAAPVLVKVAPAVEADLVVEAPVEPVLAKTPVAAPSVEAPAVAEEKDPFADDEFELALDDLELDLADIVIEETVREPVRAAALVAVAAPVQAAAPKIEAFVAPVVAAAAAPVVAPVFEPEVEEEASASELPFDPAQISESEDQVEAIAELDVPELPVEEPDEPVAYRPDYDLDIDAELATLLASANKQEPAAPAARKPDFDIAATSHRPGSDRNPYAAAPQANYAELDAFERALEEDFRRSLSAPLAPVEHEELQYSDSDYVATVESARRSVRSWVAPLVIAGVVIFGGAGAYALLGKGVPGVSSGEPVIIVADTDPIKVAPENPGGKTVPNQDKAVYDRVAGVSSPDPKQRQLISTNEQPVDVVQKTLMPDTLPLEGENDIDPTDVGQTQDPRLLPNQGHSVAANTGDQQPVAVMPRKVKTMIVRADGKLVEQEMPAPALAAPETAKVPAAGAKPVEVAAVPARSQSAPANGAAGIVPVSAPITPAAIPAQPVAAKPVAPAPVAAAPAPVAAPTAAVMPASQPAAPAAASARAPVPASRPAEQPVNVVAAVTDQGAVRAPTAAAPTQVASLGADGGYVIQIASLPSQAEAQKSYQSLSSKFGTVIGGRGVDIKAAEVAGKGTFYRVRIPAGSKDNAVALCEKYRSAGGSCLVAK
ncbi:SPOR domain-containing protein [Rhizobium sp. XQZ8]|uniref:SPOR domain-containing protein n=1 Tax=Rhizobium populisoli TaxID=2859785 RepID=UPI001CA4F652|nr:SPOR domain-containing protein [Rhizobium populisoli]MBW6420169.1 SPOR domain-containing protein [Rhizobium populisoli]